MTQATQTAAYCEAMTRSNFDEWKWLHDLFPCGDGKNHRMWFLLTREAPWLDTREKLAAVADETLLDLKNVGVGTVAEIRRRLRETAPAPRQPCPTCGAS